MCLPHLPVYMLLLDLLLVLLHVLSDGRLRSKLVKSIILFILRSLLRFRHIRVVPLQVLSLILLEKSSEGRKEVILVLIISELGGTIVVALELFDGCFLEVGYLLLELDVKLLLHRGLHGRQVRFLLLLEVHFLLF